MSEKIEIKQLSPFPDALFRVKVMNGNTTEYTVSVSEDYCVRLAGEKNRAAELLEKSFGFLLAREPKEAILREFDLELIKRYFPEYEESMKEIFMSG